MKLLTSQKDQIFDLITKKGLSPISFHWETIDGMHSSDKADLLKYNNSGFFFCFETSASYSHRHHAIYCPGKSTYTNEHPSGTWDSQIFLFEEWLTNLIKEISSPNKWDRFNKELEQLNFNSDQSNNKFSFQEVEELKSKINQLKLKLQKIESLPEGSSKILNDKLDYLIEQSKILTKFDWKSLFIGIIVNIIMSLAIPPDASKAIWIAISETFQNFLLLTFK